MSLIVKIVLIFNSVYLSQSSKILVAFPYAAYSHYTLGFRLATELAERGHEVTFINPYPTKTPIKNIKDVSTADIIKPLDGMKKEFTDMGSLSVFGSYKWIMNNLGVFTSDKVYQCPDVKNLIKSKEDFDLVIIENFISEAYFGLGHHFNAPIVLLSPMGVSSFNDFLVANPAPSSYVPNILSDFDNQMNMYERFQNLIYNVFQKFYHYYYILPQYNKIMKKAIPNSPNLEDLLYNTSLILMNSHPSITDPVPLVPAMIEIGGYHVRPPKPLPKDIQEFLDSSKEGVVYFSMGSNLKSADFPEDLQKAILNTFRKIKHKVLWKFEKDLPYKPENVKIVPWCPQQDILAHPNIVAFISHGGLLSTIEAVYYGVPIIGIPVFGDQKLNIAAAVKSGYAVQIPRQELNEEIFSWALNEILNNKSYRENAKRRSSIMHDQPIKPIDTAMYWIEYVIHHNGAPHLRVAGLNLPWYKRELLDILAVLFVIFIAFVLVIYVLVKYVSVSKRYTIVSNNLNNSKKNK